MRKMLQINKLIVVPTATILLIIFSVQVLLQLITFSFTLDIDNLIIYIQTNFLLYTFIIIIVYVFDYLCHKAKLLLTIGYDRKYVAKLYINTHLIMIVLYLIILFLVVIIGHYLTEYVVPNGDFPFIYFNLNFKNVLLLFYYSFVISFGLVNYFGFVSTTFINLPIYKSLSLNGVIWTLGIYSLIKFHRFIFDFIAENYNLLTVFVLALGIGLEYFNYKQLLKYEVTK